MRSSSTICFCARTTPTRSRRDETHHCHQEHYVPEPTELLRLDLRGQAVWRPKPTRRDERLDRFGRAAIVCLQHERTDIIWTKDSQLLGLCTDSRVAGNSRTIGTCGEFRSFDGERAGGSLRVAEPSRQARQRAASRSFGDTHDPTHDRPRRPRAPCGRQSRVRRLDAGSPRRLAPPGLQIISPLSLTMSPMVPP